MSKQQELPAPENPDQGDALRREAVIRNYVLGVLGRPADLFAVQVRVLWPGHYRVNVLVGENAAMVKVAHSYFLVMDGGGSLSWSEPEITGKYEPDALSREGFLACGG